MAEQYRGVFTGEMEARVCAQVTDPRRHGVERVYPALAQEFWESRWESVPVGERAANRTLIDAAASLTPGAALDAGCGDGADALWLAEHGWTVTAVDFAPSALERGRERAAERGFDIDWRQADLSQWTPPPATYDLVSAHYLHGIAQRGVAFRRLADAVRPGGTLLIVGHHPSSADISGGTMPGAVFFTTGDVLAALDGGDWELVTVDDDVPRHTAGHGGAEVMLRSAVVQARRR